jgi:Spy/CpxP family protein refolding chaperone
MNEESKETRSEGRGKGKCRHGRRTRLGIAAITLVGAGAVLGALITMAADTVAHGGMGGHRGFGHHGPSTIEEAEERALDGAAWLSGTVDATPEQQQRLEEIATQMVERLFPLREVHRDHRRELVNELARPELDRAELERIRSEELALAETASRAVLDAVADASEVLSPEQRQALVGAATRFRH